MPQAKMLIGGKLVAGEGAGASDSELRHGEPFARDARIAT
jgi:hypothetical protein